MVSNYATQFGELKRITIFPGISYGHLEFTNKEDAVKLLADLDAENIKVLTQAGKERHLAIFNTHLEYDELKNKCTVDFPCSTLAHTNIIPGLYVYDDFITEGKLVLG